MKALRGSIYVILVTALICVSGGGSARAQGPTPPFANCRLGVGGVRTPYVGAYNVTQLNIGRYLDWWVNSNPQPNLGLPADVEYIQTVRVHQDKGDEWFGPPRAYASNTYKVSPDLSTVAAIAASQPGMLWLIGNEMERVDWWEFGGWSGQDELVPELYATAFHEIREVIKTADPTATIGIGGVVEATPLRLKYLDRVWNSYYDQFGYSMGNDIDVWNVHGFILREVRDSWGAEIPAGLDDVGGFLYGADVPTVVAAHHNLAYLQQFIVSLRTWMAAHGQRNKPLILSEYGILYDDLSGYLITDQQVNDYLADSLYYLLTATDPATGFPADKNRLVQSWFWYSLNDDNWNGNLFDPDTKALTTFGTTWRDYVSHPENPLASQPQVNLLVANLRADPDPFIVSPGGTITVKLLVDVANSGNIATSVGGGILVKFWDGVPNAPSSNLIGSQIVGDIPGCGGFTTVEIDWPDRPLGRHEWYAEVVPIAGETDLGDNIAGSVILGMRPTVYLPVVMK